MSSRAVLSLTLSLAFLIVGLVGWGWWLAALSTPLAGVLAAGGLVVYGLRAGWGSVVPASAAISVAIALVVAFDIFPPFWPDNIHYKYWAFTVLALWALSLVTVYLLAKVGRSLQQLRAPYRWSKLGLTAGLLLALWAGSSLYQNHWPEFLGNTGTGL